ncbi:MAG TPA: lysylphosphatidylglycerol synthase domain-containing protein [Ferruginibacter sp.]|nr:lysylphosphatidylglycerol synthase domain-containing protein [Ferruginibacter sp.]HMP20865.1 lysylphosphatidylglycerol synthase domain-containing protein [Ferruginibacter sp.]
MNKSIKIILNYFLGPVVFVVLSWSLYRQIAAQPDLAERWQQIKASWQQPLFWLVILLMLINWGIESRKWQVLVRHLQPFSFAAAYKSVLAGCSITMLTPNRVGEYGGRILYINDGNRITAISLAVVGSISQLLITMLMGCAGLLVLHFFSHSGSSASGVLPDFWGSVLIYLSVAVTVVILLFYLRLGWLVRMMEKVPAFTKVIRHVKVLDEFDGMQLLRVMWLSFLRYIVFVLQYILLLWVMDVYINFWLCFWLISVFYLVLAIAPTAGFIELPVRITACWTILKLYTTNEMGVSAAALGIWLINLVLPAIIGSLLILGKKIIGEKNVETV